VDIILSTNKIFFLLIKMVRKMD